MIFTRHMIEAKTEQTSYVLQFLWRDLTSKFDIVGPYFTSIKGIKAKFIIACVFETIKLFQLYGFETSGIVCDRASTNVTAIKCTTVGPRHCLHKYTHALCTVFVYECTASIYIQEYIIGR